MARPRRAEVPLIQRAPPLAIVVADHSRHPSHRVYGRLRGEDDEDSLPLFFLVTILRNVFL